MNHAITISLQGIDVEQGWIFLVQSALGTVKQTFIKFLNISPSVDPHVIQAKGGPDLHVLVATSEEAAQSTLKAIERYNDRRNAVVLLIREMTLLDGRRQKSRLSAVLQSEMARLSRQIATEGEIDNHSIYLDLQKVLFSSGYTTEPPSSSFDIVFHPDLSAEQIEQSFAALADFYRACGGAGFMVEFEKQNTSVHEMAL